MCSIFFFFCWGIIKRGNGVGRTEWEKQEEGPSTEQMDAAVNYVEFVFLSLSDISCWTASRQDLVFFLKFVVNLRSVHGIKK